MPPAVYNWKGQLVFISYVGGPEVGELANAFSIVRGPVEAKLGVFLLDEVSSLGVMLMKPLIGDYKKVKFDSAFFVPWTAIQMIDVLKAPNDSEGEQGK